MERQKLLRNRVREMALAALLMSLVAPAFAQTPDDTAVLPRSLAPSNITAPNRTVDIFSGQDRTGPYELTYKKIPVAREFAPMVLVDGKRLSPDAYDIDGDKGTITFKESLKPAQMARVDYAYASGVSERNPNPAAKPVTTPLLRVGTTSLQMTALPNRNAKNGDADTFLVWNLNNKSNVFGGGLTSSVFLVPDAKGGPGKDGTMDRAGVSLGYKIGNDKKGLDAEWARGGRDFAPSAGKTLGFADAPQQRYSLAARYSIAPYLSFEGAMNQVRDLSDAGGEADLLRLGIRAGGMHGVPLFGYVRIEDAKTTGTGAETTVTSDQLDVQTQLGKTTALSATGKQTVVDAPDKGGDVKVVEGAVTVSTASKNNKQAATVALNGSTTETQSSQSAKQGVAVQVKASSALTVTAEKKSEVVTPLTVKEGSTTPTLDKDKTTESTVQTARAELAVLPNAKLVTGLRENSVGSDKTKSTEIGAQIGSKRIDVSGGIVTRSTNVDGTQALDTTQTKLTLRPIPTFTLLAAYTNNPETNGVVTEAKRHELGMNTKIGSLELGSNYALTELVAQADDAQTGEFSVSLGLRLARATMLSGGYKDCLLFGADAHSSLPRGLRTYTLGLTHNLGQALNFTFGGSVIEDKSGTGVPNDIKAEAKFGVKF